MAAYQMKRSVFKESGLYVEYAFHREGPPHQFICAHKGKAWLVFDHGQVLDQFKLDTPTRDSLSAWLSSLTYQGQD